MKVPPNPPASLVAYEIEPGKILFVHELPKLEAAASALRLTPTEHKVLALLLDGHDNTQLAAALAIAPRTVANHVANIFRKAGVSSRAELAAKLVSSK